MTFIHKLLENTEVMQLSRKVRWHLTALPFDCHLRGLPDQTRKHDRKVVASTGCLYLGNWAWQAQCPDNLIPYHEMSRGFVDGAGH